MIPFKNFNAFTSCPFTCYEILIEEMHGQNEHKQPNPIFLNKLQIIFVFQISRLRTKIYIATFRLWPRYASAYNNLGTVVRNTQEAEQLFRRAIALHPGGHAGAYFNLANLLR